MNILFHILLDIIFPIFVLIVAGAVLRRFIRLVIYTVNIDGVFLIASGLFCKYL